MKILKNVLISAAVGHLVGIAVCIVGGFLALKMPDADLAARIFSSVAWVFGIVTVSVLSAFMSSSSLLCGTLSGGVYAVVCFVGGFFVRGGEGIGITGLLMAVLAVICPLLVCLSGVTVLGKRKRRKMIGKKTFR